MFLRARDPKALAAWYSEHLGVTLTYGAMAKFLWTDEVPAGSGMTIWSAFPADTKYFGPGTEAGAQAVMVNYRVDDLDGLLTTLGAAGVTVDPHREDSDYGRFAWVIDPEGNRLELWQPPAAEKATPAGSTE